MRIGKTPLGDMSPELKGSLRLTLAYFCVGALWIVSSDSVLAAFVQDAGQYARFQTVKGWFYIAVTSVLFGLFAYAELKRIAALKESERRARREFEETVGASLREKEALLRELNHRVKNNLQLISSLLSLRMDRLSDQASRVFFMEFLSRIKSMALVHDSLFETDDFAEVDIKVLIREAVSEYAVAFGSLGIRFASSVEDGLVVDMEKAVPIALIINEAVLNSIDHAFPDGKGGQVQINARSAGEAVEIEVRDDGIGFDPAAVKTHSVGLSIVRALAQQIGAAADFHSSPAGTTVVVRVEAAQASLKVPAEKS